jgi:hypothetical protein
MKLEANSLVRTRGTTDKGAESQIRGLCAKGTRNNVRQSQVNVEGSTIAMKEPLREEHGLLSRQ